jgi:hypothetical protein
VGEGMRVKVILDLEHSKNIKLGHSREGVNPYALKSGVYGFPPSRE